MKAYEDPGYFIPLCVMAIIIFLVSHTSLGRHGLFQGSTKLVLALCVMILAIYGLDRMIVEFVINRYAAMAVTILVGLSTLIIKNSSKK